MPPSSPPLYYDSSWTNTLSATTIIIILYESRASRDGTRCIIKYYNAMYMPVASGTRSLAWWDGRPPSATRSTHRLCGRFVVRRVMTVRVDARGGTFAAVVASAAALCFHIHGLPPLAGSRVRIGPARPRCENRRALSSADGDSVHNFPTPPPCHPRSRLPTPNARGRAASRFSLPLRFVAFRRACASVI